MKNTRFNNLSFAMDCMFRSEDNIGRALKEVVLFAKAEGRLTCGVYEAAKMLQMNPDGIMMCIVPDNVTDITAHIYITMIEAFCLEYEIKLLKVDNIAKLDRILSETLTSAEDDTSMDCNCILIEYPLVKMSAFEEEVMDFYKKTVDIVPKLIVELPE